MSASITGIRSELGSVLSRTIAEGAHGDVHFNIAGQQANTLLHDGHAWEAFSRTALPGTRRAMNAARKDGARMFVHASFAFVHAVEEGARLEDPLRSLADTILECEATALSGTVPACVVRLGYLYGPESADLLAYLGAFRIGRPYWAGPPKALQYHLHQFDAASALLAAARQRNAGKTLYATDGHAAPFARLMDAFAHRNGKRNPLHLPLGLKPLAKLVVREEHMQQTALSMPPQAPKPGVPGWKPKFPDYAGGLDQILESWATGP